MPHALRDAGWLDRNPQARADDIHTAFADPLIKGVIASIGGGGTRTGATGGWTIGRTWTSHSVPSRVLPARQVHVRSCRL